MTFHRILATVFLLLFLDSSAAGADPIDPALQVETVVSGLVLPTTMTFVGENEILVTQQNDGRVRYVVDGVLQPNRRHGRA